MLQLAAKSYTVFRRGIARGFFEEFIENLAVVVTYRFADFSYGQVGCTQELGRMGNAFFLDVVGKVFAVALLEQAAEIVGRVKGIFGKLTQGYFFRVVLVNVV